MAASFASGSFSCACVVRLFDHREARCCARLHKRRPAEPDTNRGSPESPVWLDVLAHLIAVTMKISLPVVQVNVKLIPRRQRDDRCLWIM
jgi:hypothetical protein